MQRTCTFLSNCLLRRGQESSKENARPLVHSNRTEKPVRGEGDGKKRELKVARLKSQKTKKNKMMRNLNTIDQHNHEDQHQTRVCQLCNRDTPLYFYQQEDVVKRLPERALTKLLADLKADMELKANYLKYLKISAKFLHPCSCKHRLEHSYCLTAMIIREQRIYCDKCGDAYNLFIKQEKMCSGKLISLLIKYFVFLVIMLVAAALFLILDALLKTR